MLLRYGWQWERIRCFFLCPNVMVFIQKHTLAIHFYLIPMEGADMILSMDWLRSLNPL